jgi:hypothetical protein
VTSPTSLPAVISAICAQLTAVLLECRSKLEAVLFALRHGVVELPMEP